MKIFIRFDFISVEEKISLLLVQLRVEVYLRATVSSNSPLQMSFLSENDICDNKSGNCLFDTIKMKYSLYSTSRIAY